jgi:hypothetical protein
MDEKDLYKSIIIPLLEKHEGTVLTKALVSKIEEEADEIYQHTYAKLKDEAQNSDIRTFLEILHTDL